MDGWVGDDMRSLSGASVACWSALCSVLRMGEQRVVL